LWGIDPSVTPEDSQHNFHPDSAEEKKKKVFEKSITKKRNYIEKKNLTKPLNQIGDNLKMLCSWRQPFFFLSHWHSARNKLECW
jgi:hypothetical protein